MSVRTESNELLLKKAILATASTIIGGVILAWILGDKPKEPSEAKGTQSKVEKRAAQNVPGGPVPVNQEHELMKKGFAPHDVLLAKGPSCPKCDGETRLKSGKFGYFYGCIKFPACRGTHDADEWNKMKEKGKYAKDGNPSALPTRRAKPTKDADRNPRADRDTGD